MGSFWEDINPFKNPKNLLAVTPLGIPGAIAAGGFGSMGDDVHNFFTGSRDAEERLQKYLRDQENQRNSARNNQYQLLGQTQAPRMAPEMEKRLKALETESQDGPLVNDPLFQGDRARLVQGGQQALSGVQNVQRAQDTSGGFANQGSINDVYDRLGGQLAALGQQSRAVKEQKRDVAAEGRQAVVDAQIAYENAVIRAKMAIEAGDAAAASQAIDAAYRAREGIAAADQKFKGALLQTGATAAGFALGGPAGAMLGNSLGGTMAGNQQSYNPYPANIYGPVQTYGGLTPQQAAAVDQGGYSSSLQTGVNQPWSLMKK